MAVIQGFFENTVERATRHGTQVQCGWSIVDTPDGPLVQLDTFGSKDRKFIGKKSQTIQLDSEAASEIVKILRRAFPSANL
jgi:hypothetical protein